MKLKTKHALTPNTNERKWRQPQLQLHLVTKSRGTQELGLPTSSAAVLPLKMMYVVPIYSNCLCERQIY